MTDIMARPRRIDIGEVMNRTFGAIGPNFVNFFLLSMILAAIPSMIISVGIYVLLPALTDAMEYEAAIFAFLGITMILALLLMVPGYVLIGAVTHGSIVHFNGGRTTFGECLSSGLKYSLALIGLGFATFFGLILWYLLLFIPAILAMVRWAVAGPSLVVEKRGVWEAFKRSNELTRDNRWRVFVLGLLYFAISSLISFSISFVGIMLVGLPTAATTENPFATPDFSTAAAWVMQGVQVIYTSLNAMILAVGQTALYYELCRVKEGTTSEELAKVFD
ncbi:MAG: glycerophosphoryl diester phosphodiesterase membrane domain-containing protein [Hyphomonadaceae bacterium]|nr:glycerophosphoryl diester phosphodiesterase membrane domain-containing protein [Hyphomonadaceae bacterium]